MMNLNVTIKGSTNIFQQIKMEIGINSYTQIKGKHCTRKIEKDKKEGIKG